MSRTLLARGALIAVACVVAACAMLTVVSGARGNARHQNLIPTVAIVTLSYTGLETYQGTDAFQAANDCGATDPAANWDPDTDTHSVHVSWDFQYRHVKIYLAHRFGVFLQPATSLVRGTWSMSGSVFDGTCGDPPITWDCTGTLSPPQTGSGLSVTGTVSGQHPEQVATIVFVGVDGAVQSPSVCDGSDGSDEGADNALTYWSMPGQEGTALLSVFDSLRVYILRDAALKGEFANVSQALAQQIPANCSVPGDGVTSKNDNCSQSLSGDAEVSLRVEKIIKGRP